ncbi:MAG: methyl-accepting chemotaxis protein [Anaerolineaceae bacterium]|nr:MAG: methyl-accepting chemotaxis protein [Anaerolineaceae bacterium]
MKKILKKTFKNFNNNKIIGFRTKLFLGFLVPVVLIIIVGIVSYNRSKVTIIENYEETTIGNVDNSSLYFALLMKDIESKSSQIANSNDLIYYYARFGTYSIAEANSYHKNIKSTMTNIVQSSDGIYNAYAFGKEGVPISTIAKEPSSDIYQSFSKSEEAALWEQVAVSSGGRKSAWLGLHDTVDAATGASSDYYCASFIRTFSKGDGYIILDLLTTEVEEALKNTISSERSVAAFITIDGRETLVAGNDTGENILVQDANIAGQEFYINTISGENERGYDYVDFQGERSLFVYSKIANTDSIICTIIPENDILGKLNIIRATIIIIVIIACIIAILIGLFFTTDISKIIKKFSVSFQQVANGDLKIRVNSSRKDEFGDLSRDMDKMLENIQKLVSGMASFSYKVTSAAVNVSGASSEILDAVNGIYEITKLMGQGINDQRQDIELSYSQMSNFAEQINEAYDDTKQVDELADNTQNTVRNGKDIVNELMEQVTSTADITGEIINDIKELQEQSNKIGTVVETINEIASTTGLLSLNASIEAVRAGEAGRGFVVIASEVRKLSDQSMRSVKSIENMIVSIQEMTEKTSSLADRAKDMLGTQAKSLHNTVDLFQDVDVHMSALMDKINNIMKNMQVITVSKDNILDLIRNIAAVSEETVASSEDVASTVSRQVTSVQTLDLQSKDLEDQAKELNQAIEKFTI